MNTTTTGGTRALKIEGMSCGHCVSRVVRALGGVEGVRVVDVAVGRGSVVADDASLRAAVEALGELGYRAVEVDGKGG